MIRVPFNESRFGNDFESFSVSSGRHTVSGEESQMESHGRRGSPCRKTYTSPSVSVSRL